MSRDVTRRGFLGAGGGVLAATSFAATPPAPAKDGAALARPDGRFWRSYFDVRRAWGYADRHSIAPGDDFNLMLAATPGLHSLRGVIEISRIGSYPEGDRRVVWRSNSIELREQEVQPTSGSLGCDWVPTIWGFETDHWQPGYYTIDFVLNEHERDSEVAYLIVTDPDNAGEIIVGLCTNTYNAYNAWGGVSLYESAFGGERAQMVAFDRPASPAFFDYDYYLVTWLEHLAFQHGMRINYMSNFDVHRRGDQVKACKLFVSGCHNEYWSLQEFETVHERIFRRGRNTIFFGANSAYWQVRYADLCSAPRGPALGRQLVCYKSPDDPIRQRVNDAEGDRLVTTLFRDGARLPETMLAGVAYQNYFEPYGKYAHGFPYHVARTDLPFFAGTGWKPGQSIGDVVGYEWDNRDPDGDGKRLWDAHASRISAIDPSRLQVLFSGRPIDIKEHAGLAESVYFEAPSGGRVFSTGSIRWAWGLGKEGYESDAFRRFNRNVVLDFLGRA